MELNKVLSRVNSLIALAEHEGTPAHEAAAAREKADQLMMDYAIEEAQLDAARPAAERTKPDSMDFPVGEYGEIIGHIAGLMNTIAKHCRCIVKHYTHYTLDENDKLIYFSRVYGYTSDLRYFEILWTSVRLHALGVLAPGINPNESVDENAYRLHNAGYNWLDIAGMYGWRNMKNRTGTLRRENDSGNISDEMYDKFKAGKAEIWYSEKEDEYRTNWQLGSGIKRAYHREVAKRGEQPTKISAGGATTYRKSAARGYHSMIQDRLRRMRADASGAGTSLVLRSDALRDYFREENANEYTRCPRCEKLGTNPYNCEFCGQFIKDRPEPCKACAASKSGHCRAHPKGSSYKEMPFDSRGYSAGAEHAKSADLMAGERVSSPVARPLN